MGVTATGSRPVAVATASIANLHGPTSITEPVNAVLASVLPVEAVPPVDVAVTNDGRRAVGHVNGIEVWSIAIPRRRWLEALIGQIVATSTVLLRRLVF